MVSNSHSIKGIGKKSRRMLAKVLHKTRGYIDLELVQITLNVLRPVARGYLSRWAKNGWVKRIRRGIYIPIELTVQDLTLPIEDTWIVAHALFSPCYIGGWTAAQHWDFTEQIFNDTFVFTTRKLNHIINKVGTQKFVVRRIPEKKMFGLKTVWKENRQIHISDPHKTIVDILSDPSIAGGIRSALDFFEAYLNSAHKDMDILLEYAKKMENKTIFKRLGFLLCYIGSNDVKTISFCQENISKGYSYLDPLSKDKNLIRKWRLWLPKHFKKKT